MSFQLKFESKWSQNETDGSKIGSPKIHENGTAKKSLVDEQNPSYGLVTSSLRVFYEFFWSSFWSKSHVVGHAQIVPRLQREHNFDLPEVKFVILTWLSVPETSRKRPGSVLAASRLQMCSFWTILMSFWGVVLGQVWVKMD